MIFSDCAGSTNGANLISTHFKSHYHRLAKYYENCTVITGNLEITHISPKEIYEVDKQYERRENTSIFRRKPFWFLQNIQEISGYLLIFYVDTETLSLPNLKIIRGRHLFDGNGLKVGRNNIRYLKMPRLRSKLFLFLSHSATDPWLSQSLSSFWRVGVHFYCPGKII